ncbi:MAG: tetratricopeptide repeat protein [Alphaproteobacteria bacterium]|jgi:Flp pilus assembly protein TadD|nr:tetratricopeptide repeat protein [Alphaproteobacteria bacterium]MDP6831903.1 tetratricopeptide repeat protein [Alphaproteobacteria bacterium]MDP6874544.1 tetratricopeptide repeat protein [Alphaproteobacteria bacterium]
MRTLRQYRLLALALIFLPLPGLAAETGIDHEKQYRACIALSYRQPWQAFETAENWASQNGGAPARHCAAMALLEAKAYDRAARRLEALAATLAADHVPSPGDLLAQAANVWLLGGRAELALQAIELALQYDPDRAVYLIDRGRIRAEQGNHAAALQDLDRALALNPDDDDAAAFRASSLRHLGRADEALAAIEQALILNPNNPSARLERGILRLARGDREGARADWLYAAMEHRGTPAGDAAQARLQQMELKRE